MVENWILVRRNAWLMRMRLSVSFSSFHLSIKIISASEISGKLKIFYLGIFLSLGRSEQGYVHAKCSIYRTLFSWYFLWNQTHFNSHFIRDLRTANCDQWVPVLSFIAIYGYKKSRNIHEIMHAWFQPLKKFTIVV